jgi:hypothetical protein
MENLRSKIIPAFLWLMAPIVAFFYLIVPITNDSRIFFGVEHIAASYYPFPQGIDLAWEIKPIGNRLVNFILYKIATLFVPFDNHFLFGVAVKLLTLLAIIAVAWYFARIVAEPYSFLLVFYTFVTMANFCTLQAEYFAVLLSVLAIALIVSRSYVGLFAAGMLFILIFFIKGITGLLVVPILCGAYLLMAEPDFLSQDYYEPWLEFFSPSWVLAWLLGVFTVSLVFFLMWLWYWPNMVADILLSPHMARVGQAPILNLIMWFFAQLIVAPLYMPVLFIGFIFGAILFFAWVRFQGWRLGAAYLLMWLAPLAMVIMQGEVFLYHYLVFVPAAVVTVALCVRLMK